MKLRLSSILLRYIEATCYLTADDEEKAQFVELLELEDDELLAVLMGELEVETGEMKVLVEKIKSVCSGQGLGLLLLIMNIYVLDCSCFLMTLPVFILGRAKFIQPNEITMIFNFYKHLDKPVTQCFASIRMSNLR